MTDVDAKKDEIEEVKKDYEGENENNEDEETKIPENGSGDNNGSAKSPTESSAGGEDEEKMDQECHQHCCHLCQENDTFIFTQNVCRKLCILGSKSLIQNTQFLRTSNAFSGNPFGNHGYIH